MRASLISREVIADSIELMAHAHDFDALVCLVGCDKTAPAALMALAPRRQAGGRPLQRPDARRRLGGATTIQEVWEAVGAEERGLISRAELDELERVSCPGAGTCAGHFTANTMAVALDCLGLSLPGDGLVPADDPAKAEAAGRARESVGLAPAPDCAHVPRPAGADQRHGRDRRHAAARRTASCTSSRSRAKRTSTLSLDDLAAVGERTPVIASLAPSGAMSRRLPRARAGRRADPRARCAAGRRRRRRRSPATLAERAAARARRRRALHDRRAVQATGALHVLRGNLAPDGAS